MDRYASCTAALIGPIIAIGLLLAGCSRPGPDWIGEWRGEHAAPPGAQVPGPIRDSVLGVRLTLKPDGTYRLEDSGVVSEGDARFGTGEATLVPRRVLGRPAPADARPARLRRLGPDDVEASDLGGLLPGPVRLSRRPALPQPAEPSRRSE